MTALARYVRHGQTGILVATAAAGVILPSIIGASGFLFQTNIDSLGINNSGIRCLGAGCAEDASLIKPRSCGRRIDNRICMARATERPTVSALDGLERGEGKPTDQAASRTRDEQCPEERECDGVLVAHKWHQAPDDDIQRARAKLGDSGGQVGNTALFIEGHEQETPDVTEAKAEFWRSDTLHELQKAVRELEIEIEQLRSEESEEDGDKVILDTCHFSREGTTRKPATESRELLLYLPGVDGRNMEAVEQFDILSVTFDTWCMTVDGSDRSSFEDLQHQVLEFLDIVGVTEGRKAVIVGSSFGGLLALSIAHQCEARLKGLVLVNPATSFDGSIVHNIGSFVASAPSPKIFGAMAGLTLAVSIPDTAKMSRYIREIKALPVQEVPSRLKDLADEWVGLTVGLFTKATQENLRWRLKHWLGGGRKWVEPLLHKIALPVLVLAGSEDHLLPSVDEAERLFELIPTCQKIILRGVGHAAIHDPGEVNLNKLITSSVLYDKLLLARICMSKDAKKASKRRHKESASGDNPYETVSDPVVDFQLDMDDATVKLAWTSTQAMDRFTSPVFLSVNEGGKLEEGLGGVPDFQDGRSILFVGNHQLLGIDMPILVRKILMDKNILVRGLAHPMVSGSSTMDFLEKMRQEQPEGDEQTNGSGTREPLCAGGKAASSVFNVVGAAAGYTEAVRLAAIRGAFGVAKTVVSTASSVAHRIVRRNRHGRRGDKGGHAPKPHELTPSTLSERVSVILAKLGAVPVTPRNTLKLLRAGESVLLYPGGAKEALHQKGEDYQMFWPGKGEFVRMAASCNATIVPFAAVGAAESLEILMDLDDIFSLPFGLGEQFHAAANLIPRARKGDEDEYFMPPLAIPKVPARYYFVFGRPIDTQSVDGGDREACQRVYDQARLSVESGIEYLRAAREQDPYADGAKRLMYETVMRTQAPTFPLDAAITDGLTCPGDQEWGTDPRVDVQPNAGI